MDDPTVTKERPWALFHGSFGPNICSSMNNDSLLSSVSYFYLLFYCFCENGSFY